MHFSYSYIFLLHLLVLILKAHAQKHNSLVSTILVFGDSTADPGNNNHILTTIKSNFKPYGREFPNHVSTGRFTNGKLAYDFIAKHFGIKEYVPPYLDQSLSIEELKTGVSFASAGTGIDPLTAQHSNVIPLSKQVEYFKEYQEKIEAAIGKEQTKKLIKESLFIISIGSNDIIANYKLYPFPSENYTVSAYIDFLLQHAHNFLKVCLLI
nr:GDSL esterase/lipase At5g45960-like [Solanum lycopersicum]